MNGAQDFGDAINYLHDDSWEEDRRIVVDGGHAGAADDRPAAGSADRPH